MDSPKRKHIMNTFFTVQLQHINLIIKLNNKINRLQERRLRVTYNDGLSSFEELLERDNSVSVHNRNIQCQAIELYKAFNGICFDIMKDDFLLSTVTTRSVKSMYYGTESLSNPALKVWELNPSNIKSFKNLAKFKKSHLKTFHKPALCSG